jgi:hypothetical protein
MGSSVLFIKTFSTLLTRDTHGAHPIFFALKSRMIALIIFWLCAARPDSNPCINSQSYTFCDSDHNCQLEFWLCHKLSHSIFAENF